MAITNLVERRLIEETNETLGSSLTSFLLTGYGEVNTIEKRSFAVITRFRSIQTRKLIKISAGRVGLPHGKEPIVLLALLSLLRNPANRIAGNALAFPTEEICSLLHWAPSPETSRILHTAINKYFEICYLVADDLNYSFPQASGLTINIHRLIVGHMFSTGSAFDAPIEDVASMQVDFRRELVSELNQMSLFGVNWQTVISVSALPLS